MKLKILSLNLFEGGLLWENIQTLIARERPDILCLQEVFNGDSRQPASFQSMSRLRLLLPDYYYFFSPELYEVWSQGEEDGGNAIFSRFTVREEKTIFLHREYQRIVRPKDEKDFVHYPKNMQHAVLDIDGKTLHVLNLHGIWGFDGKDTPERLRMSEIIVDEIKDKTTLVLMGDFNVQPDTQAIANIEKHLTNVFKGELATSFNMRHKTNPGYATAVVDMVFASSDITVISKSCLEDDVSDHKPLVVTIEL